MSERPTPRTDAFIHALINRLQAKGPIDYNALDEVRRELLHHAHILEREGDEAREELARAQEALREISGLVNGAKPATDAFSLAEIWRVAEKALTESTKAKGGE